jgi:hypothetical protein
MLTKSLHTVTAVANVARHMRTGVGRTLTAVGLAQAALNVLGYHYTTTELTRTEDDTVKRCVLAVAKVIAEG